MKKLMNLDVQLNTMADKTDIPKDFFHKRYSERIASKVSGIKRKNINKYIDKEIMFCEKITSIYDKIVENSLLTPPEILGLQSKVFHPFITFKFAEEIAIYPRFESIDKKILRRNKMKKELKILIKMKGEYENGHCMFKEIRTLLDEKINYLETNIEKLNKYFNNLIFYPQSGDSSVIDARPSPTRPKNVSRTYLLALLFVIIKKITNLPNIEVHALIPNIFEQFDHLPEVSDDSVAKGLSGSRDGGMVEGIQCLINAREKESENKPKERIPFYYDIAIRFGRKKDSEKKKKLCDRLYKRLTMIDEN